MMVVESTVFESITVTVKCTIMTGLEFINIVQVDISTVDQAPSLLQRLAMLTPERKLGCKAEQG